MATLTVPVSVPSLAEDCEQLRKAFEGWGTNEDLIISILGYRNAAQRRAIREAYALLYGEDLLKSLHDEISGDFERAVLLWTLDPAERDALLANEAVRKWHPGNKVMIEIACARTSGQLFAARRAYHTRYRRSLEEDVAAHTTGDFRKLLVPLLSSYRYEEQEVNYTLAKSEAKILHREIEKKAYSDEEVIRILTTRSTAQLFATFNHYNNEFGHPINKEGWNVNCHLCASNDENCFSTTIVDGSVWEGIRLLGSKPLVGDLKSDPKDEFLAALRATIRCICCPERYFEKVARLAIQGLGTDENALTRVITTRAEVDLKDIKEVYHKRNSVPLEKAVSDDTSGDYRRMLLVLLGHDDA